MFFSGVSHWGGLLKARIQSISFYGVFATALCAVAFFVACSGGSSSAPAEGGVQVGSGAPAEGGVQVGSGAPAEGGVQVGSGGAPIPLDCYQVRPMDVRPGNPMPGAIAAAFEVSGCDGQAAPNLREADFAVLEDGEPIDATEASRTILDRKAAAFVTIVLDNSPSVAAAGAVDAVADSARAYVKTALTNTEQVYVSVASFSRRYTGLVDYTSSLEAVEAAIEVYRADRGGDNTTNLYGAYIDALNASTAANSTLIAQAP